MRAASLTVLAQILEFGSISLTDRVKPVATIRMVVALRVILILIGKVKRIQQRLEIVFIRCRGLMHDAMLLQD